MVGNHLSDGFPGLDNVTLAVFLIVAQYARMLYLTPFLSSKRLPAVPPPLPAWSSSTPLARRLSRRSVFSEYSYPILPLSGKSCCS